MNISNEFTEEELECMASALVDRNEALKQILATQQELDFNMALYHKVCKLLYGA